MIRIMLVDDHQVVREGLKRILADSYEDAVFGEAADGAALFDELARTGWDIVVLDVGLPGRSGLEILGDLRRIRPELPVLILSMHSEEQFAVRAIRARAAGYLTKESAADELVKAVGQIMEGNRYISPTLAAHLAAAVALPGSAQRPHERLSDREFLVLRMIAAGMGITGIARELSVSVPTINTYRSRIYQKMGISNKAQLVRYCVETGLVSSGSR